MASLNNCCFIGNIGKIESRFMSNGDPVVNLSLACNESYKDKNGEKVEKTEWVNVVAYKKLAEIISQYCDKGMQIYISGRMQTRKWQDSNGIDRYTTEIIVEEMKMLGGKQSSHDKPKQSIKQSNDGGFDDIEDYLPF